MLSYFVLALLVPVALPYLYAYDSEHLMLMRYPYEKAREGYGEGERTWAFSVQESNQLLEGGRRATYASIQVRNRNRLGMDFAWSGLDPVTLSSPEHSDYFRSHFTATLLHSNAALLDFGLGAATLQNDRSSWGPSAALSLELYPKAPWNGTARYQTAVLGDGRLYHELSISAGRSWRWLGLSLGCRALLNPLRNAYGPEASLRGWF